MNRGWTSNYDVITELSALELASKVEQVVRETIEIVKASLGTEFAFDVFVVLDGCAMRFVMYRCDQFFCEDVKRRLA